MGGHRLALLAVILVPLAWAAAPVKVKYPYKLGKQTVNEIGIRAARWAQSMNVDPLRVEKELHMKGVKHYVEYISMLFELQPTANATVLAWSQDALRVAHQVTTTAPYHDSVLQGAIEHETSPQKFRADSISYLRACMIFEKAGLDTTYYRMRLMQLKPRLDAHVPTRGIMQRLAFGLLYDELGLTAARGMRASYTDEMRAAWAKTSIRARRALEWYLEPGITPSRIYQLTHEVFETTNTGTHPFNLEGFDEDRVYALNMLVLLMEHKHEQMNSRRERTLDLDHLCELVMSYACFADTRRDVMDPERSQPDPRLILPKSHVDAIVRALSNILPRQTPEGMFGFLFTKQFEDLNKKFHNNPYHNAHMGAGLHCTSVCVRAATMIFRFPQIQEQVFAVEPALFEFQRQRRLQIGATSLNVKQNTTQSKAEDRATQKRRIMDDRSQKLQLAQDSQVKMEGVTAPVQERTRKQVWNGPCCSAQEDEGWHDAASKAGGWSGASSNDEEAQAAEEVAAVTAEAVASRFGGGLGAGVGYSGQETLDAFQPTLYHPATLDKRGMPDAQSRYQYSRRGRSDEDLVPHAALNDEVRSEDILRQVKYVIESHGDGFRRELLQDIRMVLLDFSDSVVVW